MVLPSAEQFDPLLLPFLSASDETEAEAELSELICRQRNETINQIVRNKLRVSLSPNDSSHENQEALELVTEVQLTLISTLRDLKNKLGSRSIGDFGAYVAAVTYNACNQLLRRKYPKRLQLKNKLRYLLTHEPQFGLWQKDRDWLCGLAQWANSSRSIPAVQKLQQQKEGKQLLEHTPNLDPTRHVLIDLLSRTFQTLGGAISLDEVVSLMIDQLHIKEDVMVSDDEPSISAEDSFSPFECQAQLRKLWNDICELPLRHRRALLLNLRDKNGADALELFVTARITTIRELSTTLGFESKAFASMWNELPWDDAKIADHLGLTRQQVINLRQSARAKLIRLRRSGD
jgi:hypothetical protein